MKKSWRILNELINRKTNRANLLSTFKLYSHEINNPSSIANQFCEFFANICPYLTKNISVSCLSYLRADYSTSMFFEPATVQEEVDVVKNLLWMAFVCQLTRAVLMLFVNRSPK